MCHTAQPGGSSGFVDRDRWRSWVVPRRFRWTEYQATECRVRRSPRALVTLRTVDQVGLPSADSAL